jgi:hypothetical protein
MSIYSKVSAVLQFQGLLRLCLASWIIILKTNRQFVQIGDDLFTLKNEPKKTCTPTKNNIVIKLNKRH